MLKLWVMYDLEKKKNYWTDFWQLMCGQKDRKDSKSSRKQSESLSYIFADVWNFLGYSKRITLACFSWWWRGFTAFLQRTQLVAFTCKSRSDLQQQQTQSKLPLLARVLHLKKIFKVSKTKWRSQHADIWMHFSVWLKFNNKTNAFAVISKLH